MARCVQHMFTIEPIPVEYQYGTAAPAIFPGGRRRGALRARGSAAAHGATRIVAPDSGSGGGDRLQTLRPAPPRREVKRSGHAVPGGHTTYPSAGERSDRT